jgi:hypothetical protein
VGGSSVGAGLSVSTVQGPPSLEHELAISAYPLLRSSWACGFWPKPSYPAARIRVSLHWHTSIPAHCSTSMKGNSLVTPQNRQEIYLSSGPQSQQGLRPEITGSVSFWATLQGAQACLKVALCIHNSCSPEGTHILVHHIFLMFWRDWRLHRWRCPPIGSETPGTIQGRCHMTTTPLPQCAHPLPSMLHTEEDCGISPMQGKRLAGTRLTGSQRCHGPFSPLLWQHFPPAGLSW